MELEESTWGLSKPALKLLREIFLNSIIVLLQRKKHADTVKKQIA